GRYWGDGNCRIYLKKGARFNLRTALAQAGRQGAKVTGDRVKLARIGDKAIVSICDGTGTGPRAAQESDGITDVLVGLYQLGLEAMDAVKILNGFWASLCCEEFPSLDVAVVYLQEGYCEFIKLGAPPSFIWGENGLTIVPAGGALLGLDGHRDPFRYGVQLRPGDNVIMVTDGYLSHFGHQELAERLASVMSSRRKKHFVELAEALLECATGVSNGIKDD
ncbi:MAG: SpoIIE family protein phosphatase, partial [Clostridia bacterium]|nr:SpoIIE family protein phosphatase [Clostridia bacterium]